MPVIDGVLDAQIDAQVADGGAGALQMQSKIAWVQPVVLPALVLKYTTEPEAACQQPGGWVLELCASTVVSEKPRAVPAAAHSSTVPICVKPPVAHVPPSS